MSHANLVERHAPVQIYIRFISRLDNTRPYTLVSDGRHSVQSGECANNSPPEGILLVFIILGTISTGESGKKCAHSPVFLTICFQKLSLTTKKTPEGISSTRSSVGVFLLECWVNRLGYGEDGIVLGSLFQGRGVSFGMTFYLILD